MLTETHTPVGMLISQCQQLAEQLFREPVRVRVSLLPSLDGDSFRADVRSLHAALTASESLLTAEPARGKLGALHKLLAALRDDDVTGGTVA